MFELPPARFFLVHQIVGTNGWQNKLSKENSVVLRSYDLQRVGTGSHTVTTPPPPLETKTVRLLLLCQVLSCFFFKNISSSQNRHHTIQHFHLTTTTLPLSKERNKTSSISSFRLIPWGHSLSKNLTWGRPAHGKYSNSFSSSSKICLGPGQSHRCIAENAMDRWTGEIHWFDEAQCVFSGLKSKWRT